MDGFVTHEVFNGEKEVLFQKKTMTLFEAFLSHYFEVL